MKRRQLVLSCSPRRNVIRRNRSRDARPIRELIDLQIYWLIRRSEDATCENNWLSSTAEVVASHIPFCWSE